jgi:peroxiredoxin
VALTYTPSAALGMACPDFSLLGVDGKTYALADFKNSKAFCVMFICNHCPYVKAVEERLLVLGRELKDQGISFAAICSNDPQDYPEDSFENLKKSWTEKKYPFPYLFDETQAVALKFGAVCTPDFFVYDKNMKLTYRGRLDDSWKDSTMVKHQELRQALLDTAAMKSLSKDQPPSMGCSIKWKKGNRS